MPLFTPTDPALPRIKAGIFNLAQNAGTYDLLTASGDVYVEVLAAYAKVAAVGLTSASIATDHTVPKSVVASALAAAITLDLSMTVVTNSFVLQSGKKIKGTIVGNGSGGEIDVVVRWQPVTAGATLS